MATTSTRAKDLIDLGNKLFTAKAQLDNLCQEIAEVCYPEYANFTTQRQLGDDFASHLTDGKPSLARRELCNSFSSVLRPRDKHWFQSTTFDERLDADAGNARFMEYLTGEVRSAIYDPRTKFVEATKTADHDFGTFGNAVVSVEESAKRNHLFFKAHHFKDCAWLENDVGTVDHLHRRDRMTARALKKKFGEKALHETVRKACETEPHKEIAIRVVVMPADEYDYEGADSRKGGKRRGAKLPFVICYIDADNAKVLREGGLADFIYMVARWHRIPGFQYAFSPAAMTALPDMRMAQDLALLILEAGERSVYPPALAREEAIQQSNTQAGSITWAHLDPEQKLEEAMRYMEINANMTVGFGMQERVHALIERSWFLDKLGLPDPVQGEMTAYETARRFEQHVRQLLPLFEPMEIECNSQILDKSFAALANMRRFDWSLMPESLRGRDVFWSFKNPMQEASSRVLISQFTECLQIIAAAREFAGGQLPTPIKVEVGLRDAIRGTSAPATWRKTEEEEAQEAAEMAARAKIAGAAQELAAAGDVAARVGQGAQALQGAGILPFPGGAPGAQPGVQAAGAQAAGAQTGIGGAGAAPGGSMASMQDFGADFGFEQAAA